MNPIYRINQFLERAENAEKRADIALSNCESAQREVALLRSQLADARQQLERDSATIAKLSADKRELVSALKLAVVSHPTSWAMDDCRNILSRHA